MFKISASSLYDGGLQHGKLAREQIVMWSRTKEFKAMEAFAKGPGKEAFEALKQNNSDFLPQYVRELEGIADGAGVDMDNIWLMNMINEIEALMPESTKPLARRDGHCSDIYGVNTKGYVSHGHNEDWSEEMKPLWYWLFQSYPDGSHCSGLVYPGTLVGWAVTFNHHGVLTTQNSLFPQHARPSGLISSFVQRWAICNSSRLEEVATRISNTRGWAQAASLNIVDLRARKMANMEIWEDEVSRFDVVSNYSHFNIFKQLRDIPEEGDRSSSHHRQARVDAMPRSSSWTDIVTRLGDQQDRNYPIYRNITLSTVVLDGLTGVLRAWDGENPRMNIQNPTHVWNLLKNKF